MKKSSDATAWLRNNPLRLLQEYWMWILLTVVLIVMAFGVKVWIEVGFDWLRTTWSASSKLDLHEQIDIKLKIIGGVLSGVLIFVGLVIATWRSVVAERQVRSAEKGQYSVRFAKAVGQIASNQLAIRLGGLASIEALSKETKNEFIRVWTYLGQFLRYPPELAQWSNEPKATVTEAELLGKRPDITAVATMLRSSDKTHLRWVKKNRLPLSYANLHSADLRNANLQGANLVIANLQGADLHNANLQGAVLFCANLQGATLLGTNLRGAILLFANLQGADLRSAKLQDANLVAANLQGADLRDSWKKKELQQLFSKNKSPLLKDALFSLDVLKEALRINVSMPEKMSEVYYNASDGPLPHNWPTDCTPSSITYNEWRKKREKMLNTLDLKSP